MGFLVERVLCGTSGRLPEPTSPQGMHCGLTTTSRPERDGSALCRLSTMTCIASWRSSFCKEDVRCTCDMRDAPMWCERGGMSSRTAASLLYDKDARILPSLLSLWDDK